MIISRKSTAIIVAVAAVVVVAVVVLAFVLPPAKPANSRIDFPSADLISTQLGTTVSKSPMISATPVEIQNEFSPYHITDMHSVYYNSTYGSSTFVLSMMVEVVFTSTNDVDAVVNNISDSYYHDTGVGVTNYTYHSVTSMLFDYSSSLNTVYTIISHVGNTVDEWVITMQPQQPSLSIETLTEFFVDQVV